MIMVVTHSYISASLESKDQEPRLSHDLCKSEAQVCFQSLVPVFNTFCDSSDLLSG